MNEDEIISKIKNWLKAKIEKAQMKGFVLGLSGGLDSSVVAVLCKYTNYPTLAVILPCHSPQESIYDAKLIAEKYNINYKLIDLSKVFDYYYKILGESLDLHDKNAISNIKPRLRMTTLYYIANNLSYLVVGTGNLTELQLGYFTKYGDGGVDLLPIGDLVKEEIIKIAYRLKIPDNIVKKPPSADLWEGQTDEGEIGFSYAILDKVVRGIYNNLEPEIIKILNYRINSNKHKRETPPICKIH
jgi:NAD+ synthase